MGSSFARWIIFSLFFVFASSKAKDIYDKCGKTATCLGINKLEPHKLVTCPKKDSCAVSAVLVPPKDDDDKHKTFHFHLQIDHQLSEFEYMGLGLTTEGKMNKLLIFECVRETKGLAYAYISWATSVSDALKSPPARIYGGKMSNGVSDKIPSRTSANLKISVSSSDDDVSSCDFVIPRHLPLPIPGNSALKIDLVSSDYYVSVAMGSTCGSGPDGYLGESICRHKGVGVNAKFNLMAIQAKVKLEKNMLRKFHAFLMVLAYFVLMPCATIIARFFRESFSTRNVFNKRIWFTIHVALLYLALCCTFMGYIFMAIGAERAWPTDRDSSSWIHATVGMLSMLLHLSQTIIPWVIPSRQLIAKRTYSVVHAGIGSACYFLGLLNILLAPILMPQFVSCSIILITFTWMGSHFCFYWLFVTLLIIKDHEMINNNSRFRAIVSYPMRLKTMDEAPGTGTRVIFFCIFVLLSLASTIAMAMQIFQDAPSCPKYSPDE